MNETFCYVAKDKPSALRNKPSSYSETVRQKRVWKNVLNDGIIFKICTITLDGDYGTLASYNMVHYNTTRVVISLGYD